MSYLKFLKLRLCQIHNMEVICPKYHKRRSRAPFYGRFPLSDIIYPITCYHILPGTLTRMFFTFILNTHLFISHLMLVCPLLNPKHP